jgi:hypothetical protein
MNKQLYYEVEKEDCMLKQMDIRLYYHRVFAKDLTLLDCKPACRSVKEIQGDPKLVFFGGTRWATWEKDMESVALEHREYFIICLFITITVAQAMYSYFPTYYRRFRQLTCYPNFGWCEIRQRNENPKLLLNIPLRNRTLFSPVVDFEKLNSLMPRGMELFYDETDIYFKDYQPEINTVEFFRKLLADPDFQVTPADSGTPFKAAYNALSSVVEAKDMKPI